MSMAMMADGSPRFLYAVKRQRNLGLGRWVPVINMTMKTLYIYPSNFFRKK